MSDPADELVALTEERYWANWSAEDLRICDCGHLRGDHSAHDPAACLQRLCLCDTFTANGGGHE